VEDGTSVVGIVLTERENPIGRATVLLGSPELGTHYQTVSDADGGFAISNVVVGRGYQLRVLPEGSYLDYSRERIRVPEDGLSLEVVLETLATGRLTGRMLDLDGNPVADFRIWLLSSGASRNAVPITSDERGYFELVDAPAGSLTFDTRASPRHTVSGVFLPAEGEREVSLVLDWGALEMTGEVLDDRGDPVGGAEVSLSWSDTNGEIQSTSSRATRTDPSGLFRFTQLGPGEHLLEVRAAGYLPPSNTDDEAYRASSTAFLSNCGNDATALRIADPPVPHGQIRRRFRSALAGWPPGPPGSECVLLRAAAGVVQSPATRRSATRCRSRAAKM
jgi:hypothetical protein